MIFFIILNFITFAFNTIAYIIFIVDKGWYFDSLGKKMFLDDCYPKIEDYKPDEFDYVDTS